MLQEQFEQELSPNPSSLNADEELARRLQQEFDAQSVISLANEFNDRITQQVLRNPSSLHLAYLESRLLFLPRQKSQAHPPQLAGPG
jgi:hypothetical protein